MNERLFINRCRFGLSREKNEVFPVKTGMIRTSYDGLSAFVRVTPSGSHQKNRNKYQKKSIQILPERYCETVLVFLPKKAALP